MIHRILMTVVIAGFTLSIVTAASQAPSKSTNDGVYTKVQGERGQKVFAEKCTACHEPSRFSGEAFHESWDGKALKELWDVASGTMPEDNPGSLKQQEYGDIIAYFLSLNDYPAGEVELQGNAAAMAAIKVEKKKPAAAAAAPLVAPAMVVRDQKSVKAGVYTAAQADRGQALYRSKCASCHAPNRFTDDLFYSSFAGKPMWEMFDAISDTMPEDNPGSMKKEEYADVLAYLLKLNKFPTGDSELPFEKAALNAILMEKP